MALHMEWTDEHEQIWQEWLSDRPAVIRDLATRFHPAKLYLLKTTGQKGTIESFGEDGTIRMQFDGRFCKVVFAKSVFGLKPDDIEECELPGPDEEVGNYCEENDIDPDEIIPEIRAKMIDAGYLTPEGKRA